MTLQIVENQNSSDPRQRLELEARQLHNLSTIAGQELELGRALLGFRAAVKDVYPSLNGEWRGLLGTVFPEADHPEKKAARLMAAAQAELTAYAAGPAPVVQLDERAKSYAKELRRIAAITGRGERKAALLAWGASVGIKERQAWSYLNRFKQGGAAALVSGARSDKGRLRAFFAPQIDRATGEVALDPTGAELLYDYADEVTQFFWGQRLGEFTSYHPISEAIRATKDRFPQFEGVADKVFYKLEKEIPGEMRLNAVEYEKRFAPWPGGVDVPYPNYSWDMDETVADMLVWDGNPNEAPYRPYMVTTIDQFSGAIMFSLYTKEPPNRQTFASVLLNAVLPKGEGWPQCGLPERLHLDNGSSERSHWLQGVGPWAAETLGSYFEINYCHVRKPWEKGVVESWHRIVHTGYEMKLGRAYIGNSPMNKPAHHPGIFSQMPLHQRKELPTLEAANIGLWAFIVGLHKRTHDRYKMSRNQYWALHAKGHMRLPQDIEVELRELLMRKDDRKCRRGFVELNNAKYINEQLNGYDGLEVRVVWDPANLLEVRVFYGSKFICLATRAETAYVDQPETMKALVAHKQRVKARYKRVQAAKQDIIGDATPLEARQIIAELGEKAKSGPLQLMPKIERVARKKEITADEILADFAEAPAPLALAPARTEEPDVDDDDVLEIHGVRIP